MMVTMWVYLETWIVKDGALLELARGSHLRDVGLRAECGNLGSARTAVNGIAELADPGGEQGSGSYRYELTGVAGHAEDVRTERGHAGSEFVITAGDQAFVARTAGPASPRSPRAHASPRSARSASWPTTSGTHSACPICEPTGMCDDWRSSTGRSITPRAVRRASYPPPGQGASLI
jgi:hypothetical protein